MIDEEDVAAVVAVVVDQLRVAFDQQNAMIQRMFASLERINDRVVLLETLVLERQARLPPGAVENGAKS